MAYIDDHLPAPPDPVLTRHFPSDKTNTIEHWSEARLHAYHAEAVRALLRVAAAESPFYRAKLRAAGIPETGSWELADLTRLPLTTRAEVARDPWALVTVTREEIAEIYVSTGTSGAPGFFVAHAYHDLFVRDLAPAMPVLVPLKESDLVVNALPYEMSSAGMAFHRVFTHGAGAAVFAAGKDGCYGDPTRTRTLLAELRASVLITSPSYAVRMLEAERTTTLPAQTLRLMWLTGEPCSPSLRRRLEDAWGCPARFYYGSLECGCIGIECSVQDGYHVAAGHVWLEILDPTGRPLGPGEIGEIVVTVLLRRAMPLIRYRTGDLGYLEDVPCPCGVTLPRLVLRGRTGDHVRVGQRLLSPVFIEEMLMRNAEIGSWYQIHDRAGEPVIEAVASDARWRTDATEARLASRLEYQLGAPVALRFVDEVTVPRGKVQRVLREEARP